MKLLEWMAKNDISVDEASRAFGGKGASIYAIRKWIKGERAPRPVMQVRIKTVTKGAVTGNDWLPSDK